jgi:hypothetical protein
MNLSCFFKRSSFTIVVCIAAVVTDVHLQHYSFVLMTLLKLPLMSVAVVVVFFSVPGPIFIIPVVARAVEYRYCCGKYPCTLYLQSAVAMSCYAS